MMDIFWFMLAFTTCMMILLGLSERETEEEENRRRVNRLAKKRHGRKRAARWCGV